MPDWLHDRFIRLENPHEDLYYPRFGTFNWLRSVSILSQSLDATTIRDFYRGCGIARRANTDPNAERIDTETYGCLFLSMQYYAALYELTLLSARRAEIFSRIAIVDWYYGLYWAANAMLLARVGEHPEMHAPTARRWCTEFAMRNHVPQPFSFHATTLVEAECDDEINALGQTSNPALSRTVSGRAAARRNCLGALKGTAQWYRDRKIEEVRDSSAFKALGVSNFRTNAARAIRDAQLQSQNCGFLHQAFRARGKANYRDALYVGYGDQERLACEDLVEDLRQTLEKFLLCAATFCRRRVQRNTWEDFIDDLNESSWFDEDACEPLTTAN